MDLTESFPSHPSEETFEEYVFQRLPESLTTQIEEHLLICESCQVAVQEIGDFVLTMKAAVGQPVTVIADVRPSWAGRVTSRLTLASIVALSLLGVVVFRTPPNEPVAPVNVRLSSLRGVEALSVAPAGRQLRLNIEAPDLTSGHEYRIEMVDAAGSPIWEGGVTDDDGQLSARISKPLVSGVYWVRLYDAAGRQLREFGMSVK